MRLTHLAVVVVATALAAGCSDDPHPTSSSSTTTTATTATTDAGITDAKIGPGYGATDGGLRFTVTRVERTTDPVRLTTGRLDLGPSEAAVVVTVDVTNVSAPPAKPFCVDPGIILVDDTGGNRGPEAESMHLPGSDGCGEVRPGQTRRFRQLFSVPREATNFGVGLWSSQEPGDSMGGSTWVRFSP